VPEFISPPNLADLNPVDYSIWSTLQEKMYKTRITDLDDLKHRIKTDWAKLNHAVIAAAVRQWRRRLSACGERWSFRALLLILSSDIVFLRQLQPLKPSFTSRIEQLQPDIPV